MKLLFDTSVLVAGLIRDHPAHGVAKPWLEYIRRPDVECAISAHGLAELYVSLPKVRARPFLSPQAVITLIEQNVTPHVTVRALSARAYLSLIRRLAAAGLYGAVVYDAIHAEVGRRAKVDLLVTLNPRDFQRVWTGRPEQVVSPIDTSPP